MKRRQILAGVAVAPLMSVRAAAQQRQVRRLGVLTPGARQWENDVVLEELGRLGHDIGQTLLLDVRSADDELERLPALAVELVDAGAEVILAANTPAARAAIGATSSIPVVIGVVSDPVLLGFADRFSGSGRNVTGVSNMSAELVGKRLEVFKEALPRIRRIVTHYHPEEPISVPQVASLDKLAQRFDVSFEHHGVRTVEDVEASLRRATEWSADALLRLAGQGLALGRPLAEGALRKRLPSMVLTAKDVRDGGLISYFADHSALWRRAAQLVHRVLTGTHPASLPFEQPTKFDLTVNLRTAELVGVSIAPSILARADEVIE